MNAPPSQIANRQSKIENPFAAGYCRVSTDLQDLSIEAQTGALTRHAAAWNLPPPEIYADSATSGTREFFQRPEGARLLHDLREARAAGRPCTLIVPKVDRLGRNVIDINTTVHELVERLGVRVCFLDLGVDTSTAMGRAFMQIAAVFAELERERIVERINDTLAVKRGKGEVIGTIPYGYDAELTGETSAKGVATRRLLDNAAEQQTILLLHQLRQGGWGYQRIATELNRRGIPTKRGRGDLINVHNPRTQAAEPRFTTGQWQAGNVSHVLNSKSTQAFLAQQRAPAS